MNGQNLFLGMNYIDAKFVEEAESVTELKREVKYHSIQRIILIAALVALMLFLMGSAVVSMVRMRVSDVTAIVKIEPTVDNETHTSADVDYFETEAYIETVVGEAVHFEKEHDIFSELDSYYPQYIPDGYAITFVSEGVPLPFQRITYENDAGGFISYEISIGFEASNFEIYAIITRRDVKINGQDGILYEQENDHRTLVWVNESQGYGFYLTTDDPNIDLIAMAESVALGSPLVPTYSDNTVKALEELGDFNPSYLPESYEEHGVLGWPLEDGSWYSYVRKYYVNKTENTNIFFEYSTYVIDTASGYEDNVQTICSFQMPEFDANMNRVEPIETEINGMYGLMTDTTIAWADPERHVVYKLYSKDVIGEELLNVAQSICSE